MHTFTDSRVVLDISREDFQAIILVLSQVTMRALQRPQEDQDEAAWHLMHLANRLNEGNPNWEPYEIYQA